MLMFILGFLTAWLIVSIVLYYYDSSILCPDGMYFWLSLPMQIISIPYYLIKEKRKEKRKWNIGLK